MMFEHRSVAPAPDSHPIAELLSSCHVLVVVGPGGVGKTTTAAALGVAAAVAGRRVLCLTIDPARRLAQALGLNRMESEEQEIDPDVFARSGVEMRGRLTVMMLDARAAFDRIVLKHSTSPERVQRLMDNALYQHVSRTLSGTQEYMAMETLVAKQSDPRFDLIVLDTPPTANALDFLDAPRRLVDALDSSTIRWLVDGVRKTGHASLNLIARTTSLVARGLARVTGVAFLNAMAELVSDMSELFDGFKERAERVEVALRAPDVSFVMVTSPGPASISEILFLGDHLESAQMRRGAIVVNRFRAEPGPPAVRPTESDARRALADHSLSLETGAAERMILAYEDAAKRAELDVQSVARLDVPSMHGVPVVLVPERAGDIQNIRSLVELGVVLTEGGV